MCWLLTPPSRLQTTDSWLLTPDSWLLTPDSWLLTPDSWLLTPDSWLLTPDSWFLTPDSRLLNLQVPWQWQKDPGQGWLHPVSPGQERSIAGCTGWHNRWWLRRMKNWRRKRMKRRRRSKTRKYSRSTNGERAGWTWGRNHRLMTRFTRKLQEISWSRRLTVLCPSVPVRMRSRWGFSSSSSLHKWTVEKKTKQKGRIGRRQEVAYSKTLTEHNIKHISAWREQSGRKSWEISSKLLSRTLQSWSGLAWAGVTWTLSHYMTNTETVSLYD